jgi:ribosomal protein L16 Arg81 hydroxylase
MLDALLGDLRREEFFAQHFGRTPFARPSVARRYVELLDADALDRILGAREPDLLVVERGRLLPDEPPRSLAEARAILDRGASIVIRKAQELDPDLARFAARFAAEFGPRWAPQIQLFVTPAKARGFGWHYDYEDVFLFQTVGTKRYLFRRNTVDPDPAPRTHYDFSAITRETTPTMEAVLAPGDFLYLPRGWWHVASAIEESWAISLGIA